MGKAYDGAMALYGLGKKLSAPAVGVGLATQSEDADAGIVNVIDEATGAAKRVIEAWHGSPYKFDKFSMDSIGTGEGAQAYGHGLYFADAKDVGRGYRDDLGLKVPAFDGVPVKDTPESIAHDILRTWDAETAPKYLQEQIDSGVYKGASPEYIDEIKDALARNMGKSPDHAVQGSLYKVHLDVDPDTLLDWDKPLSEQPGIMERLGRVQTPTGTYADDVVRYFESQPGKSNPTGSDLMEYLRHMRDGDAAGASKAARHAGIPGIRYLDGMSRDGGSGTYNYVMFDDAPISIMERGNAAPELLGYMGAVGGSLAAYGKLREEKEGRWSGLKQDALSLASGVGEGIGFALEALEMPTRGLHGVASAAGVLFFGGSVEDAVRRGATVAQQPLDTTAQQVGQYVADETGNPYLAAGADAITRVMALEP